MLLTRKFKPKLTWLLVLGLIPLTGCFVEVSEDGADTYEEDSDGYDGGSYDWSKFDYPVYPSTQGAMSCDAYGEQYERWNETDNSGSRESGWRCFENNSNKWRASCQTDSCQQVSVYVHYMLTKDLGPNLNLHVEAFNNQNFQGQPIATVRHADFDGDRGNWKEVELFLDPGEFYIRAYLTNRDDISIPYVFGDMELVADKPIGIFGALGAPQLINVKPVSEGLNDPVKIYLDRLFEKPGEKPDTQARIRINLTLSEGLEAPDRRNIHIELRNDESLETNPVASFQMASESLLVTGRVGSAEFISPSLELSSYFVFVFLDENGNGLFDEFEISALYERNTLPQVVKTEENKTKSINLILSTPGSES
jgi:hypothetical protein